MKKLLALVLALAMMLCMGTALADGDVEPSTTPATDKYADIASFTKTYVDAAGKAIDDANVPNETLTFTVAAVAVDEAKSEYTLAEVPAITVGANKDNKVAVTAAETIVPINLPTYTKTGVITYTIKEDTSLTKGVTSDAKVMTVKVMIERVYAENGTATLVPTVYVIEGTDGKKDNFENKFETGSLTITKEIKGNMADKAEKFDVKVTFTSDKAVLSAVNVEGIQIPAVAFALKDGKYVAETTIEVTNKSNITFSNLPVGVEVAIEENPVGKTGKDTYTANEYTKSTAIKADGETVAIVNTLETTVATGINMDSMPYIVLMGLVVLAGVALILKKRTVND